MGLRFCLINSFSGIFLRIGYLFLKYDFELKNQTLLKYQREFARSCNYEMLLKVNTYYLILIPLT